MSHFARALLPALLLAVAGCSSSDGGAAAGGEGGGAPAGDGGPSDGAKTCEAQNGSAPPAGWQCVKTVDAVLVGVDGAPLAGANVTACGRNICNYAKSDASGKVHFDVYQYMDAPAFKVPAETPYVQFAWLLPKEKEVHDLGTIKLVPLPVDGAEIQDNGGMPTTAAQTVTNGGVSLELPAQTTITIDTLTLQTPDQQAFRALVLDDAQLPPSVDPSLGLGMVVSLGPLDTLVDPPAAITLPNPKGWAAGSQVELFLHGVDLTSAAKAPYGKWQAIGTGTVAQDGKSISSDPGAGNGVPELSLLGVRPKT